MTANHAMEPLDPMEATDMPLVDLVRIDALASVRRMERASQLSATIKGDSATLHQIGDSMRGLEAELDAADARERRREELLRLPSPSALIARMKADWPAQAAAVQRLAKRQGIGLGEAWAQVIAAGVAAVKRGR